MAEVVVTKRFRNDLSLVTSDRLLLEILDIVDLLKIIPSMGSSDVPKSVQEAYGPGVKKIAINPFDIITIFQPDKERVIVAQLLHQRMAKYKFLI